MIRGVTLRTESPSPDEDRFRNQDRINRALTLKASKGRNPGVNGTPRRLRENKFPGAHNKKNMQEIKPSKRTGPHESLWWRIGGNPKSILGFVPSVAQPKVNS